MSEAQRGMTDDSHSKPYVEPPRRRPGWAIFYWLLAAGCLIALRLTFKEDYNELTRSIKSGEPASVMFISRLFYSVGGLTGMIVGYSIVGVVAVVAFFVSGLKAMRKHRQGNPVHEEADTLD